MDIDVLMDSSQDFDADAEVVVRWVASQSPNPALQALMKEAEREKRSRPATPVSVKPFSWTRSLAPTSPEASSSTSAMSSWNSNNTTRTSSLPSLSIGSASLTSSSPFHADTSDPLITRRVKPSCPQRKPLSASTSSANQAVRSSMSSRLRSSSHSTSASSSKAPTSKGRYKHSEDEPEAVAFLALLRDVSRQVDENSRKKQRLAARTMEKMEGPSMGSSGGDNPMGSDMNGAHSLAPRVLVKTSSASAIYSWDSSGKMMDNTSGAFASTPKSVSNPGSHGRALTKTESLSSPDVGLRSGRSTPVSVSNKYLTCDLKHNSPPRVLTRTSSTSTISNTNTQISHNVNTLEPSSEDGERNDIAMKAVPVDLNATDAEWRDINSDRAMCLDTTSMQVNDEHDDLGMDVALFQRVPSQPQPSQQHRVLGLKPPSQINITPRQQALTQRPRTGPPLLGMRRPPQLLLSQHTLSQTPKNMTVPRFKPPLLPNGGRAGSGSGAKPSTTNLTLKQPPRRTFMKEGKAEVDKRGVQDPDSSFDVSFDMDEDALEEAMKAYD
ncbi:hypothetical protein PAXRUDRAFT_823313 [Paxillus rubicundulus Ve08.2h10]|uniref:Uncharacterized protein n=1 Tax=Paxillus rubicundulus Ve08.2h10 TaxID=930991 RepID=A0A0D0EC78_9AGAM|nr:hypothetical protein PAXRUDRAFT_823313 [Paxillus rubicundulus Ve08.2h10]